MKHSERSAELCGWAVVENGAQRAKQTSDSRAADPAANTGTSPFLAPFVSDVPVNAMTNSTSKLVGPRAFYLAGWRMNTKFSEAFLMMVPEARRGYEWLRLLAQQAERVQRKL